MKPVVDRLKAEYEGRIDFRIYGRVNSDRASGQFANQHGVAAIPTMVLVAPDGTERGRLIGAVDEDALRTFLEEGIGR